VGQGGRLVVADAGSDAIVQEVAAEVAEWLGFASAAEFDAASPEARQAALMAADIG